MQKKALDAAPDILHLSQYFKCTSGSKSMQVGAWGVTRWNSSSFLTCDIYFYFASCAWWIDLLFNIMDKCHQWFHPSQWWEHTVILIIWRSRRRQSDFWVSAFILFGLCWDLSALCNPRKTVHYILKSLNQQEREFWWKKVFAEIT